jgi:hypothetical protein
MLKRLSVIAAFFMMVIIPGLSQQKTDHGDKILFHGLVTDASSLSPIAGSQVMINGVFTSVSGSDGTFAFYVLRHDTVVFRSLGYKPVNMIVSDTLSGNEFLAGVFMKSDTLSIGEVVILPKILRIRSEMFNPERKTPSIFENARYNVAVSAYQGRNSQRTLGDPASNYSMLRQKQKKDAYEKGGIPSDKMVGISPLLLLPAAYLLINGLPEGPEPMKPQLTDQEIEMIHRRYLETFGHK